MPRKTVRLLDGALHAIESIRSTGVCGFDEIAVAMQLIVETSKRLDRLEATAVKASKRANASVLHMLITANSLDSNLNSTAQDIIAEIAQVGREIHSARSKDGIARARAVGRRIGRPLKYDAATQLAILRLAAAGESHRKIEKILRIPRSTVRRIMKKGSATI